jgi:hypothetical protein
MARPLKNIRPLKVFSGAMPMIAGSLPDFGPVLERYAADLQSAGENK